MFASIYIEDDAADAPRSRAILDRFPTVPRVACRRYNEVFNPRAQNFRLQKNKPSLILAHKRGRLLNTVPAGYDIGARHNYYFSHMLNCIYDCRYCFLQGMYRSANYVLFVNYESFHASIRELATRHPGQAVHVFSGYDCDSLAMDPVTRFCESFIPVFATLPEVLLELRTKSTQIRSLLAMPALENCVIAYSFTPTPVSLALEHGVPGIAKRVAAMCRLQQHGWPIALRFDPLIYFDEFRPAYEQLFELLFSTLDADRIHSVSIGPFRLPRDGFNAITRLYPDEKLFASARLQPGRTVSYDDDTQAELVSFCREQVLRHIADERLFMC